MNLDTIECADVMSYLRGLPDNSVNCVVTSPPYYGLRDYGTANWQGGDAECEHMVGNQVQDNLGAISSGMRPGADASHCRKCGAVRIDQQIGLEPAPQEFVATMVNVFREVRRVLREDGVCWLNLGDSHWGGKGQSGSQGAEFQQMRVESGVSFSSPAAHVGGSKKTRPTDRKHETFKAKDLMMIPHRVAIALQDDGWYVRMDIVWHKPNPMPESVTDRPTKSHEYIFLLTKSANYWYDADAIREPQTGNTHSRGKGTSPKEIPQHDSLIKSNHSFNSSMLDYTEVPGGRNKRSVWTVPTEQNSFAHFATFPRKLIEPMILAGCPAQVCSECREPYTRVIESTGHINKREKAHAPNSGPTKTDSTGWALQNRATDRWEPTCGCQASVYSGIVLDPFMGSGTTALVARANGRHYLGCDLNPEYVAIAQERLRLPFEEHHVASDTDLSALPLFGGLS